MTPLDRFIEPITVANEPIGNEYTAYKMDSTDENKNMRKMVGLGTCHCCDYFRLKNDVVILIEETKLLKKIEEIKNQYSYLKDADKTEIADNRIRDRMQLKAYGTMMILSRLVEKFSNARKLIENKKCHFWLVASGIRSEDDERFFDNRKDFLQKALKDVLGGKILDDVEVFSSKDLPRKLSQQ